MAPFDPNSQIGLLTPEKRNEILLPPKQVAMNIAASDFYKRKSQELSKDLQNLSESQILYQASFARHKFTDRAHAWLPLDSRCIPVVNEEEERNLVDDVLSSLRPKIIYSIIPPKDMTVEDALTLRGNVTGITTTKLPLGQLPDIPSTQHFLDIHKDFCPAYVRLSEKADSQSLRSFDRSQDHQRIGCVKEDDIEFCESLAREADVKYGNGKLAPSLAQQHDLEKREMCDPQVLGIDNSNPFPNETNVASAKSYAKNLCR